MQACISFGKRTLQSTTTATKKAIDTFILKLFATEIVLFASAAPFIYEAKKNSQSISDQTDLFKIMLFWLRQDIATLQRYRAALMKIFY